MTLLSAISTAADQLVQAIDPQRSLKRAHARAALAFATENGYLVPGSARKSMRGVTATLGSPAGDIDRKLRGSRAISRDMSQNTALATAIFRRYRTNVIGPGLQVQPRPDWKFLKISSGEAAEFSASAIREFDMWSNSLESDYCGQASFQEQQGLLFLSALIDGDSFFALPWVRSKRAGWPYETTIRVIDADLVRTPDDDWMSSVLGSTDARIRNGIEYDPQGRLVAYWVATFYADDYNTTNRSFRRIPIYDQNGERQIFQIMEHERFGQRRGLPLLAPVVDELKTISRLCKAELMSHLLASMFTVFIRDNTGMGSLLQEGFTPSEVVSGGGGAGPNAVQESKFSGEEFNYELGSGSIYYLDDGKTIDIAETREKKDFAPFMQSMAALVSAAVEIPNDIVLQVFNKSYSALRGAVLEAWKRFSSMRTTHGKWRIVQPVYEAVMSEAILRGRIRAPGFFDDIAYRTAWLRCEVVGAGSGQIDPVKEARAAVIKISNGLSTREEQYALDRGGRWNSMIERSAAERDQMVELGLDSSLTLDGTGDELEGS
jgi:lambda family phage portal protein